MAELNTLSPGAKAFIEEKRKLIDQLLSTDEYIDSEITPYPSSGWLRTNNFIQNTLSRLMGWDRLASKWRAVEVNEKRQLLVTLDRPTAITPIATVATVTITPQKILSSDVGRASWAIINMGANNVYLIPGVITEIFTGFVIPPNSAFSNDDFTGDVWVVTLVGTSEIRYIAF